MQPYPATASVADTGFSTDAMGLGGIGNSTARPLLAVERICPSILSDPSGYDDALVALCLRAVWR